ncbi:hypothetical protein ACRRTK_017234 [Alexandromys fortis]
MLCVLAKSSFRRDRSNTVPLECVGIFASVQTHHVGCVHLTRTHRGMLLTSHLHTNTKILLVILHDTLQLRQMF